MTQITDRKKLAIIKQAMADKYERLAKSACSVVKQRSFSHNAAKYRKQAAEMDGK